MSVFPDAAPLDEADWQAAFPGRGAPQPSQGGFFTALDRAGYDFFGAADSGIASTILGLGTIPDDVGHVLFPADNPVNAPAASLRNALAPIAAPFQHAAARAATFAPDPTLADKGIGLAGGLLPAVGAGMLGGPPPWSRCSARKGRTKSIRTPPRTARRTRHRAPPQGSATPCCKARSPPCR